MKLKLIVVFFIWLTTCCKSEEVDQVFVVGIARYIETNLAAEQVPVELTVYDLDGVNPRGMVVSTQEVTTDKEGHYRFLLTRSTLPRNAGFTLSISTDSLVLTGEFGPGCLPSGFASVSLSTGSTITRDLKIDFPTFLQVTFDKLDHSTTDRVRLLKSPCILLESTLERPDTTILQTLHFFYSKTVDIQYQTVSEDGGTTEHAIAGVVLSKNDTTKLTIEY